MATGSQGLCGLHKGAMVGLVAGAGNGVVWNGHSLAKALMVVLLGDVAA